MNAIEHLMSVTKNSYSDREFLIDSKTEEHITFNELHDYACSIAKDILGKGLKKGDRIVVLLDNSIDTALLYFGCLFIGVITVPINPIYTREEISYFLRHSNARTVVVSDDTIEKIDVEVMRKSNVSILKLVNNKITSASMNVEPWNLRTLKKADDTFQPFKDISPDDTMTIIYTSGTTAQPKGVVHRISDLIDNARLFTKELGIGSENRFYGILSMTYLGGYYNLLLLPYVAGASVVLARTFNAQSALDFWRIAIKYEVNTLWLVPTIMSILLKMDRGSDVESFCKERIKCALVGTAPLSYKLKQSFESRYGLVLYENYGLSETLFISTNSPQVPRLDGCVGRVLPGIQVTILDNNGGAMPYGEEGEIFVRTPYLMEGYYNAENGGADYIHNTEWFGTGDIGVLTANGDLFISGRKKDLIIRGGINISPAAIENILHENPAVEQAAIVGVPHEILGEDIVAVLKLKDGFIFHEAVNSIKEYSRERMGAGRDIGHFLEIDEFPLGPTGKILKQRVREIVLEKLKLSIPPVTQAVERHNLNSQPLNFIPGRIRKTINRPNQKIINELKQYSTSLISDCINRMGAIDGTVYPIIRNRHFCGPAITIEEVEGGNLMSHAALEFVVPGDVLVIDAKGITSRSCWGGLQTHMAKKVGCAGIVVYGAIRDYDDIARSGVPVYAMGCSPGGPLKGWSGNVNYPIACGGTVICPGDLIVGDDDGVVAVPSELVDRILPLCKKRLELEKEWFEKVNQGISTIDAVGLRSRLNEFKIEVIKK
jgi:long-chain acyl-CoA synthetase